MNSTRVGGEARNVFSLDAGSMWATGKRSLDWDLNDWKWDGDLFIASPLNPPPSGGMNKQFVPEVAAVSPGGNLSNSSSTCSDDVNAEDERCRRELEKKRRLIVVEDEKNEGPASSLCLKLGNHGCSVDDGEMGNGGKKSKIVAGSSRAVCQVEGCGSDLSNAKDYHRRHKVCETHSKATKAFVGNALQRFCQQCSRFHVLQEFDEGKRSCRRRLAGHNKRRRKTHPEASATPAISQNNEQTNSYLLISLLRILSNMHSNRSDQPTDQELISHLLKSVMSQTSDNGDKNISRLLQNSQILVKDTPSVATPKQPAETHDGKVVGIVADCNNGQSPIRECCIGHEYPLYHGVEDCNNGQVKINNFDLNDIYIDSDDGTDDVQRWPAHVDGNTSLDCRSWAHQNSHHSSPPQTSVNSDSMSGQSPSNSGGDGQSRTDRIIFKLFGKEPNDIPLVVRTQILDWLSHSPTDIESYIRPGCVVLTLYIRQTNAAWEDLCYDLTTSLNRLVDITDDPFWRTGWMYVRVQHQVAFVHNGQVVVDRPLPTKISNCSKIFCIKPIAVPSNKKAHFLIKGINLSRPSTRLLCSIDGNYITEVKGSEDIGDIYREQDCSQIINYSCSIPPVTGRGFIEIDDQGFSSSFFPFLVTEEELCSEIRVLENALDIDGTDGDEPGETDARNSALKFLNEMGWVLHRSRLKTRLGLSSFDRDGFPLKRFRWLVDFSIDREWCSVLRKLLDTLFDDGLVSTRHNGDILSENVALSEMGLLHKAVRTNSRSLVEFLLNYCPKTWSTKTKDHPDIGIVKHLFTVDALDHTGLTPLHIVARQNGAENVLDALTNDPQTMGIEVWKDFKDSHGLTSEHYARMHGHESYVQLVQRKINKRGAVDHVAVHIPRALVDKSTSGIEIEKVTHGSTPNQCKLCSQQLAFRTGHHSLVYRPAMLFMIAIAAVCVCAALYFKSGPRVVCVFRPFRWELLEYGTD